MRRTLLLGLACLLLLPARGAPADERPVVVVTPGSARTFRAAIQSFADRSAQPNLAAPCSSISFW